MASYPGSTPPRWAPPTQLDQPRVEWAYLSQDEWHRFVPGTALPEQAVRDESHGLTEQHPVYLALPDTLDTRHTVMPDGLCWLRASVARGTAALSRVRAVHPQVVRADRAAPAGGAPLAFGGHLPAHSLARLARAQPGPGPRGAAPGHVWGRAGRERGGLQHPRERAPAPPGPGRNALGL